MNTNTKLLLAGGGTLIIGLGMVLVLDSPAAVGAAFVIMGALVGYFAYKRYSFYRDVSEDAADLSVAGAGDSVSVDGRIRDSDGSITAPFSGEDAVVATWVVEEWDEQGDNSTWVRRGGGITSAPFEMKTDSGHTVEVDITDEPAAKESSYFNKLPAGNTALQTDERVVSNNVVGDLSSVDSQTIRVGPDEEAPAEVKQFLDSVSEVDEGSGSITNIVDAGRKHGKRRYIEWTLEEGDSIHVHGEQSDMNRVEEASDGYTVVSSMSGAEFRESVRESSMVFAAIAVSSMVVGVVGLLL